MVTTRNNIYEQREYAVTCVAQAKTLSEIFLLHQYQDFEKIKFGLHEIDDRYHVWRIPVLDEIKERIGELVIEGRTGEIDSNKSSDIDVMLKKTLTQGIVTIDKQNAPVLRDY